MILSASPDPGRALDFFTKILYNIIIKYERGAKIMFGISPINPNMSVTGLDPAADAYVVTSASNADNVINDFEKAFSAGMNPNNLLQDILDQRNLTTEDFTDNDIIRVNRKVEEIYKTIDYQAWRQR